MKNRVSSATCLAIVGACAMSMSLAAQQAPAPTQGQASASAQARSSGTAEKMTVTGCIQAAPPRAVGTTGSAASAANEPKFMLTNITPAAKAENTAASTSAPKTFALDANEVELSTHVGQKVEVTGTVDGQSTTASSSTSSTGTAASAASTPRFKVESMRMVSAMCAD